MSMHLKCASAAARVVNKSNSADDVLIRIDSAGFIVNASHNASNLGLDLSEQLVMPHIGDLAVLSAQADVTHYFEQVIAGLGEIPGNVGGVEFPLHRLSGHRLDGHRLGGAQMRANIAAPPPGSPSDGLPGGKVREECSLKLVRVEADEVGQYEALGTLRCVEDTHLTAQGLASDIAIDSVTGLCERRGFAGRLTQSLALGRADSIALFAIDGMKAIYMNYGQSTADEVRWGFARFLEAVTEKEHFLAQVDDERFGIILPDMTPREARKWCAGALELFAGLTGPPTGRGGELTASAGIASTEISAEWTLRQAELGLIMARSAGGMQTGYCRTNVRLSDGEAVEKAIERAAEQAAEHAAERAKRRVC